MGAVSQHFSPKCSVHRLKLTYLHGFDAAFITGEYCLAHSRFNDFRRRTTPQKKYKCQYGVSGNLDAIVNYSLALTTIMTRSNSLVYILHY